MYKININNQIIGPMTIEQLMAYPLNMYTPVMSETSTMWAPLYQYPELMDACRQYGKVLSQDSELSNKKILCGIMAILFGTLGIQYFICGKVSGGLLTILISLVTCGAWGIVTLIQGIMMLCMDESEFNRKYIESTSVLPLF